MLSLPESGTLSGTSSVIYYQVHDLDQAVHAFKAKGVVFLDDPHELDASEELPCGWPFFTIRKTISWLAKVRCRCSKKALRPGCRSKSRDLLQGPEVLDEVGLCSLSNQWFLGGQHDEVHGNGNDAVGL